MLTACKLLRAWLAWYTYHVRSRDHFRQRFPEYRPQVSYLRAAWNIWVNIRNDHRRGRRCQIRAT